MMGILALLATNPSTVKASKIENARKTTSIQVSKNNKNNWDFPFACLDRNGVHPIYFAQKFGNTDYARSINPLSYFHDGWDFGQSEVGHTDVRAIHPGTVKQVAYGPGLGWYVLVTSPDKYAEIYQEGFNSRNDIVVNPGQKVQTDQKIGLMTGNHLHLGLTKTTNQYLNSKGYPCNNWNHNNGTWLNPVSTIEKHLKNQL